jgi:hypothetical protein
VSTKALPVKRRTFGWLIKIIFVPCVVLVFSAMQAARSFVPPDNLVVVPVATSTRTQASTPRPTATMTLPPPATATLSPIATRTSIPTKTSTPVSISAARPISDSIQRAADVPILMYHYISAPPSPTDALRVGLSVPPEKFDAEMKLLADNGYHTVTLLDVYTYLQTGKPLPAHPIILTFDDGYVDNYQFAFPILKKYGMLGTFFILSGPIDNGNPNYLTWDMVK